MFISSKIETVRLALERFAHICSPLVLIEIEGESEGTAKLFAAKEEGRSLLANSRDRLWWQLSFTPVTPGMDNPPIIVEVRPKKGGDPSFYEVVLGRGRSGAERIGRIRRMSNVTIRRPTLRERLKYC